MLDYDLAELYHVTTRNLKRFPDDFMFGLTKEEARSLLLQNARAKTGRGGRQTPPYAFTEHGVAMLSSVLRSDRAVMMNILIVRAFVKLREILATHKELARAIEDLGRRVDEQGEQITAIIETINNLLGPGDVRAYLFLAAPQSAFQQRL
jgi:phage regulator Rha-like protein